MNFLCLQGPQKSDDQQVQPLRNSQRRSVKPLKLKRSHKDLQQISQSRFIKTTFNKSNLIERGQKSQNSIPQPQPIMQVLSKHLKSQFQYPPPSITNIPPIISHFPPSITNPSPTISYPPKNVNFNYCSSYGMNHKYYPKHQITFGDQAVKYQPRGIISYANNFNSSSITDRKIDEELFSKELNAATERLIEDKFNLNYESNQLHKFTHANHLPFLSYSSYLLLSQPATNNIHALPQIQSSSLPLPDKQPQLAPAISNQLKDQQQQLPLKSKFMVKKQRSKSLISEQQIKKGFNNNFISAKSRVERVLHQQQQQPIRQTESFNSNSIVSKLINESYSPLKKEEQYSPFKKDKQNSSIKKRKRPIFDSNHKTASHARQSRPKATSQYNNSSVFSFGTPQSIKPNYYIGPSSALNQYELKTEQEQEVLLENGQTGNQTQEIVPKHILNAWKKARGTIA